MSVCMYVCMIHLNLMIFKINKGQKINPAQVMLNANWCLSTYIFIMSYLMVHGHCSISSLPMAEFQL